MARATADLPTWLSRAEQLSHNLWWTWHSDVPDLLREIDVDAWVAANHNPISMLRRLDPGTIAERIRRLGIDDRIDFQYHRLQQYLLTDNTWCSRQGGIVQVAPVAYFSAEFGIRGSLPLYSGGLGVLVTTAARGRYRHGHEHPVLPAGRAGKRHRPQLVPRTNRLEHSVIAGGHATRQ